MTNLEWLKTLSAEELADWLYDEWLHHLQYRWSSSRGGLIIWLKDCKDEPTGYNLSPVDKDINVRSKDEPQPSKIIEAYAKGYKDGADAVKGIKDKQIRACDICKYEIGETCTHPKVKTMKKEWATFEGDLWGEENTPKWCPIDKDEPQTDTEIAKAIIHKMIDDAVIAEDAYPDLRQKMHDAVDEYEPQERSE